jgi:hypothetical protein
MWRRTNLHAETLEANNQDVGLLHLLHGFVAQDVQLSAIEAFVNMVRHCCCFEEEEDRRRRFPTSTDPA